MKVPIFQVDAFTQEVLSGNPAAVCPLNEWLPDDRMQSIALENNLSETAFFVKKEEGVYDLRWFTPTTEVELCGHATLASSYVIWDCLDDRSTTIEFDTRSGRLKAGRQDGMIALLFPEAIVDACPEPPGELTDGLGATPVEVFAVGPENRRYSYLAIYESSDSVCNLAPNLEILKRLGEICIIATAPGGGVDFVSRFFAPRFGIDEDPVTGSAHCALVPFWAERLGKKRLHARQVSARGGELFCERRPDGIVIAGHAVLYMEGVLTV